MHFPNRFTALGEGDGHCLHSGKQKMGSRNSQYLQAHSGLYSTLLYQGQIGSFGFFLSGNLSGRRWQGRSRTLLCKVCIYPDSDPSGQREKVTTHSTRDYPTLP